MAVPSGLQTSGISDNDFEETTHGPRHRTPSPSITQCFRLFGLVTPTAELDQSLWCKPPTHAPRPPLVKKGTGTGLAPPSVPGFPIISPRRPGFTAKRTSLARTPVSVPLMFLSNRGALAEAVAAVTPAPPPPPGQTDGRGPRRFGAAGV